MNVSFRSCVAVNADSADCKEIVRQSDAGAVGHRLTHLSKPEGVILLAGASSL